MQLFRDTMDLCGFIDLCFKGNPFTWKKHFKNRQTSWERLDRGLVNNEWLLRYGGMTMHHLTCSTSGHCPLLIEPEMMEPTNPKKPFRFEEMWLAKKGCSNTVKQVWSGTNFGSVRKVLKLKQKLLAQAELEALTTGFNF